MAESQHMVIWMKKMAIHVNATDRPYDTADHTKLLVLWHMPSLYVLYDTTLVFYFSYMYDYIQPFIHSKMSGSIVTYIYTLDILPRMHACMHAHIHVCILMYIY